MFQNYFAKLRKRRLRRYIRTWQKASPMDPLDSYLVLQALEYNQDKIPHLSFSGFVPIGLESNADTGLRQKLFGHLRSNDSSFRQFLLHITNTSHHLVLPIPDVWRRLLQEHGFRVNVTLSRFFFAKRVLLFYLRDVIETFKILRETLTLRGDEKPLKPYGMLLGLNIQLLPKDLPADENRDYVNWYRQWADRDPTVCEIWGHCPGNARARSKNDVRVIGTHVPFPPLKSYRQSGLFALKVMALIFRSGVGLLWGRWWWAMILKDAVLAAYGQLLDDADWAREYIFHNGQWAVVRPLWSYQAEAASSRILVLYYSVNTLTLTPGKPPRPCLGSGEGLASWPNYVVTSKDQGLSLIKQRRCDLSIFIDPLLSFTDSAAPLPDLPWQRAVAVFDISPRRVSWLAKFGFLAPVINGKNSILFLTMVERLLQERGLIMVIKRKRTISRKLNIEHTAYLKFMEMLINNNRVIHIDPDVSAYRVIERCAGTISMPLTTTAVIASALKKPSVYLDPTGIMADLTPEIHGVQIISDEEKLGAWLDQILTVLKNGNYSAP